MSTDPATVSDVMDGEVGGVSPTCGTSLDVEALRAETPGCTERIHLNNAGAALPTRRTLDAVIDHLELEARIGGYEAAEARSGELLAVRGSAARLLGVRPDEVAVTTSDTVAWTKALWGFGLGGGFTQRRRIVADRVVYNSHWFGILQAAEHFGLHVDVVPPGDDGTIDADEVAERLGPDVAFVTATHVPTHSGLVNPVAAIGAAARGAGVPYFVDACQSVGQLPVDMGHLGCDVLTATGRKWLRGPRGTGLLAVREDFAARLVPPGIDASSAEWNADGSYSLATGAGRFEEFETPVAAQLGLGAAIDQLLGLGIDAVTVRIAALADSLRSGLASVDGVQVTDGTGSTSGIVTFSVTGCDPADLAADAATSGINVSVSRASHARLDLDARGLTAVVRAAPHVYNTLAEIEVLVDVVGRVRR